MTLADAQDLLGTWEDEPPAFLSLAKIAAMLEAWFGVKRGAVPDGLNEATAAAFATLREQFGEPRAPGADPFVYDFAALKARHSG